MIRMTNIRIHAMEPLPTFNFLKELIPLTERRQRVVEKGRLDVTNILGGIDKRLLIIAGPCSIHDYRETVEIAQKISALARKYSDKMAILMRVCLDKPRTKKDWCGFLNDPKLDGSHDIPFGYKNGRKLMGEILDMGLPIACELLTPINFHIVSDMVSYAWVGARTVASPETRNMSSGLSVPVGIKNPNSTDNITDALNAMEFVTQPGVFPGPDDDGVFCRILTRGNPNPNLILRGGKSGPNYKGEFILKFVQELRDRKLPDKIVVDCSHGNCEGDHKKQLEVFKYLIDQKAGGLNPNVVGVMIESYLDEGKQDKGLKLGEPGSKEKVKPRLSVTDACISESDLENALAMAYQKLS
ncbi:MAG: 3-deoxy-7-phosphoheptulonate synthase [Candidatus Pacebacteria bacterium]|nr:3-deoxy-7-phosphoheptulonate synthase [Candidatus Paceibacterota bacterium]